MAALARSLLAAALAAAAPAAGFKVIGAGYPKTGVASLETALRMLGYKPYRMGHRDNLDHVGHAADLNRWLDILASGSLEPLDQFADELVLRGYDAILDVPMDVTEFALRLAQHFPDARVILTEHADSDAWFKSFQFHMRDFKESSARFSPRPEVMMGKAAHALRRVHEAVCDKKRGLPLVPTDKDAGRYIAAYEKHNAEIKAGVPSARLLEFEPQRGWEPLCGLLGVAVPEVPYPQLNTHDQDAAHLEWQRGYNFRFEAFLVVILGSFVLSLAYAASNRWKAHTKVCEEKANV